MFHRFFDENGSGAEFHKLKIEAVREIKNICSEGKNLVNISLNDGSIHAIEGHIVRTVDGKNGNRDHYFSNQMESNNSVLPDNDGSIHSIEDHVVSGVDGINGNRDQIELNNSVLPDNEVALIQKYNEEFNSFDSKLDLGGDRIGYIEASLNTCEGLDISFEDIKSVVAAEDSAANCCNDTLISSIKSARLEFNSICEDYPDMEESVFIQTYLEDNKVNFSEPQLQALLSKN